MNKLIFSVLVAGVASGLSGPAQAQLLLLEHASRGNAVNYCQAFTPGPSNTIRNRVIGVENVGSAPVAVACSFQSQDSLIYSLPKQLTIHVSNTSASTIDIVCTKLVGHFGESDAYAVTRSATVPANSTRGQFIRFTPADNPAPFATTLGDHLIGVNCTLPAGGGLNETELVWSELL